MGPNGRLLRDPVVTDTSGFPELDRRRRQGRQGHSLHGRARKVARRSPESCIKFKVKFVLKNELIIHGDAVLQAPLHIFVIEEIMENAAADAVVVENPYGIEALWGQGDAVARGTLIILLIMSAVSWYIIFTKLWDQRRLQAGREGGREAVLELGLP